MIGSLYVTASRPYVMQEIGQVARFQETPKETHVLVVTRIFKYLKGTTYFGLWYLNGNELTMVNYTDADVEISSEIHYIIPRFHPPIKSQYSSMKNLN
jgi:hypothetical protein